MNITYSFIVPHRNSPESLNRLLNSIPERDDIQIIVIDDNSDTDKKPNIKRDGVKLLLLKESESKGAGHARNVGLAYAVGKWVLFADSDDYYEDGFIFILDNYSDKDIDVLFFNCKYVDSETLEELPLFYVSGYINRYDGTNDSLCNLKYRNNVPWSKMVRRDYISKYNFSFEEIQNGNDYMFSILVGHFCKTYLVEKRSLYIYTKGKNGLTNKKRLSETEHFCKLSYILKRHNLFSFLHLNKDRECYLLFYFWYLYRTRGIKESFRAFVLLISNIKCLSSERIKYKEAIIMCERKGVA